MSRVLIALAALGALSGCGIPGGLERPDPMWNEQEAIERECTRPLRRGEERDPRCAQRETLPPQQTRTNEPF